MSFPAIVVGQPKLIFFGANLLFAVTWLQTLVFVVSHWNGMSPDRHWDAGILFFFAFIWVDLLERKDNAMVLFVTSFAFTCAASLLRHSS